MATSSTSFKQQCPSCEAMVPIRDPKLIGRKIDCPECKYRFIVEKPADEPDEDDDAEDAKKPSSDAKKKGAGSSSSSSTKVTDKPSSAAKKAAAAVKNAKAAGPHKKGAKGDEDDGDEDAAAAAKKPKKSKKGGSNSTLLVGGGLAVIAVVAVIVCAFAFGAFDGGGSGPKPGGAGAGGMTSMPPVNPATGGADQGGTKQDEKDKEAPKPVVLVNITNLLPNDTQTVISYPMPSTVASSLHAAGTTQTDGCFDLAQFRDVLGFNLNEVHRLVTALNGKDKWVFSILQTKEPFKPDLVKASLRLKQQPAVQSKTGRSYDFFLVQRDLGALATMLLTCNQPKETFAVHIFDANTMIFADPAPLKKFLEQDGKPEYLTKENASPPSGTTTPPATGTTPGTMPPGTMPPGTMPPGTMPPGTMPPAGTMPPVTMPPVTAPPGTMPPTTPPPGTTPPGPMPPTTGTPMPGTPTPGMPMPGMPGGTTPMPGSGGTTTPPASDATVPASYMTVEPALKQVLDRVEKLEENKQTNRKEPTYVVAAATLMEPLQAPILAWFNAQMASNNVSFLEQVFVRTLITTEMKKLKAVGGCLAKLDQANLQVALGTEYHNIKEAERQEREARKMLPLLAAGARSAFRLTLSTPNAPMMPPGMGGTNPGIPGTMPPGTMPPVTMPPGSVPMPGFPPGTTLPGTGTTPPGTGEEDKGDGSLVLKLDEACVTLALNVKIPDENLSQTLFKFSKDAMHWLKSQAELASTQDRYHELARALKAYTEANKGSYPRGALERPADASRIVPWRPDERLSWVVALLPHLNEQYREWKINPNLSWNEGENQHINVRVVPGLLAHRLPGVSPAYSPYPGASSVWDIPGYGDRGFAVTHFVAMAGLGFDAAEYRANDPTTEKKAGIFGYDRVTKKSDIKDGPDKTIAFIMVPDEHKAPWLLGGGATVRAVSEDLSDSKPMAPFVCTTYPAKPGESSKWLKKRGTLAIMGDGKVRFIPEDLPAATFRALCTIAGGETIPALDTICPVIEDPEEQAALRTVPPTKSPVLPTKPPEKLPAPTPEKGKETTTPPVKTETAPPKGPPAKLDNPPAVVPPPAPLPAKKDDAPPPPPRPVADPPVKKEAPPVKPKAPPAPVVQPKTAAAATSVLTRKINFGGIDDPSASLADALDFLSKRWGLTFSINDQSFKKFVQGEVQTVKIARGKPIPAAQGTTLDKVLTGILSRVPGVQARYRILPNGTIEILAVGQQGAGVVGAAP